VLAPLRRVAARRWMLGVALAACTVLMGVGLLGLSGWFIAATALAGLGATTAMVFDVFMPSAGIRLLALGRTASRYAERLVTHEATLATLAVLRESLFRGWAQPAAARQLALRPVRLLFRLSMDVDALESLPLRLLVPLASAVGGALLAGVVLAVVAGWPLAWTGLVLTLWLLLTGLGTALWLAHGARRLVMRRAQVLERLRAQAIDLVAGQTELAMAGRLRAQCDQVHGTDLRLQGLDDGLHRLETQAGIAHALSTAMTLAGALLLAGMLVESAGLPVPAAVLVVLVALAAIEPFGALRRGALEAGRTLLAAHRLAPRMAEQTDAAPVSHRHTLAATARTPAAPQGMALHLKGMTAAHPGSRRAVLCSLSLQIAVGEKVALVGSSGAGKSTLMAIAAGELSPLVGDCHAMAHCLLTQRSEVFQDDLRGNLLLADPQASDARLWAVLEAAGLARELQAQHAALDTPLGEGGLGLSGGQLRRLALARLLLRDAPLWLLDEPTEALDATTARDVLQRLARHGTGHTLLIATHLRREAALADRLLVLQDGRLAFDLRRGTAAFDAELARLRPD
jgi:ATP-binding cassette subfamily C protein CydC